MSCCDRRKQRKYRREWLDTWERWLHDFETVVFVWQTSHVGASINDWPDELAAEVAESGDISDIRTVHRSYCYRVGFSRRSR